MQSSSERRRTVASKANLYMLQVCCLQGRTSDIDINMYHTTVLCGGSYLQVKRIEPGNIQFK